MGLLLISHTHPRPFTDGPIITAPPISVRASHSSVRARSRPPYHYHYQSDSDISPGSPGTGIPVIRAPPAM
ncbi:hypothetical protein L249_7243, partial [Ophiocordyceps polyrhachis-furcata BCC 54312]